MIQGFYTRMQESCYIMRLWPYNITVQREIISRGWQGHWSWVNTHITGQRSQPDGSEKAPTGEQKNLVLVIHPTPKGEKKASYFYRISHFVRASNKTEEREKEKKKGGGKSHSLVRLMRLLQLGEETTSRARQRARKAASRRTRVSQREKSIMN